MKSAPQLDLLRGRDEDRRPDLAPTPPLARHPSCPRVLDRIRRVRLFFPELDGISIRVGLTRAAAGFAAREEFMVWMNPSGLTLHTIAHELTHLLQNLGHVPKGEKSADLFALARHRTLVDEIPCYLKVPRPVRAAWPERREEIERLLHRTAREAVQERDNGCRTYLRWFERTFADRWFELAPPRVPSRPTTTQLGLSIPRRALPDHGTWT
ncbi:MAG: hypothetical protein KDA27_15410 [Candidatus Eisenbacteria bacterium]|uniref:Uncharacterized protein n=1 Tax=Eiseniibacteriota bacterium TaxID=2212470 RepID=A0A956SE01_UNCEI|nr:hypothetical protein [Candidatus Eisenbacteria bacterium]MCB9465435.1 hypothetical protein [Candidatus Eisenbacteria bacterium]